MDVQAALADFEYGAARAQLVSGLAALLGVAQADVRVEALMAASVRIVYSVRARAGFGGSGTDAEAVGALRAVLLNVTVEQLTAAAGVPVSAAAQIVPSGCALASAPNFDSGAAYDDGSCAPPAPAPTHAPETSDAMAAHGAVSSGGEAARDDATRNSSDAGEGGPSLADGAGARMGGLTIFALVCAALAIALVAGVCVAARVRSRRKRARQQDGRSTVIFVSHARAFGARAQGASNAAADGGAPTDCAAGALQGARPFATHAAAPIAMPAASADVRLGGAPQLPVSTSPSPDALQGARPHAPGVRVAAAPDASALPGAAARARRAARLRALEAPSPPLPARAALAAASEPNAALSWHEGTPALRENERSAAARAGSFGAGMSAAERRRLRREACAAAAAEKRIASSGE